MADTPELKSKPVEPVPRLALNAREMAQALGIGQRLLWSLTNRNEVPHARLDGRIVYPVRELQEYLSQKAKGKP